MATKTIQEAFENDFNKADALQVAKLSFAVGLCKYYDSTMDAIHARTSLIKDSNNPQEIKLALDEACDIVTRSFESFSVFVEHYLDWWLGNDQIDDH